MTTEQLFREVALTERVFDNLTPLVSALLAHITPILRYRRSYDPKHDSAFDTTAVRQSTDGISRSNASALRVQGAMYYIEHIR